MGFAGNPSAPTVVPLPHTGSAPSVRAVTQRTTPSAFDAAIEHFAHGQWSKAFEDLVPLADSGDRDAARIVMPMAAHGPRLSAGRFRLRHPNASVGTESRAALTRRNETPTVAAVVDCSSRVKRFRSHNHSV